MNAIGEVKTRFETRSKLELENDFGGLKMGHILIFVAQRSRNISLLKILG
ncbi:MAG: hypothetical protein ABDH32_02925 [Candidatus Caldarchaeales archaeon]